MNIIKEGNNERMTKSAQTLHQKRIEELPSTPCHGWLSICIELPPFTTEMSSMQEHIWRQADYILWGCDGAWGFRTLCLCPAKLLLCQKQKAVLETLVCNFLYADTPCSLYRHTVLLGWENICSFRYLRGYLQEIFQIKAWLDFKASKREPWAEKVL